MIFHSKEKKKYLNFVKRSTQKAQNKQQIPIILRTIPKRLHFSKKENKS